MASNYPRSPKVLKGAFVKLSDAFLGPVPEIIVFQYNPESMTRQLEPSSATEQEGGRSGLATRTAPFAPRETFEMDVELDASDDLEVPEQNPASVVVGVADRIAAMEGLMEPEEEGDGLLSDPVGTLQGGGGGAGVSRRVVPVVLFVWGPGRILPVRVTRFQVEEEAFLPSLYPLRATVGLSLQVFTRESFETLGRDLTANEERALAVYQYTRAQTRALAAANIANTVESILGMLPF